MILFISRKGKIKDNQRLRRQYAKIGAFKLGLSRVFIKLCQNFPSSEDFI